MDLEVTKPITDRGRKASMTGESEEELTEEQKRLVQEHADYVRLHKKPLQFGIEAL